MAIELELECDPEQACHFSPVGKAQFGYINALCINEEVLSPDIMVAEPLVNERRTSIEPPYLSPVFQKSVVGVLEDVNWESGRRADSISFTMLASAENSARLEHFFRRQAVTQSAAAEFGLIVYAWDYKNDCYYVRFCTHKGSSSGGGASDERAKGHILSGIYKEGSVEEDHVTDLDLGAILFRIEIELNPTAEEQRFRISTSRTNTALLPWGEEKEGQAKEVIGETKSDLGGGT